MRYSVRYLILEADDATPGLAVPSILWGRIRTAGLGPPGTRGRRPAPPPPARASSDVRGWRGEVRHPPPVEGEAPPRLRDHEGPRGADGGLVHALRRHRLSDAPAPGGHGVRACRGERGEEGLPHHAGRRGVPRGTPRRDRRHLRPRAGRAPRPGRWWARWAEPGLRAAGGARLSAGVASRRRGRGGQEDRRDPAPGRRGVRARALPQPGAAPPAPKTVL